jgi:alpha-glucosidase (family GH31 glycosyl hydrolase)
MVTVIHNPFGQQHPYEQLPEERFPRQPIAGQSFIIGITTRPPQVVRSVTVHSTLNGEAQPPIQAQHIPDWQEKAEEGVGAEFLERQITIEQDVWQATLQAPEQGQTLVYWMQSDDGSKSETFIIKGEAWETGGGLSVSADGVIKATRQASDLSALPNLKEIAWLTDGEKARQVRLTFNAIADEGFFGLGERFNALNQRGNILDVRVYEQYKNHGKKTYMPIPFLLSSAGYGLHIHSSRWMAFDLCATTLDEWVLIADLGDDQTLSLKRYESDNPAEIIGQYATETGPVTLPPDWAFGLWMSGNEWNTQAKIEQEVKKSLELGIQPAVVVIEAWSDENTFYIWNEAEYTPKHGSESFRYEDFTFPKGGKWTDPKGMTDWLHENGIKLLLWQIPIMKVPETTHAQQEADRAYFEEAGFGVKEADGSLHRVRPFWFRDGYIWDMTNPAERQWWFDKRVYLLEDVGVDGFKTDGGEHLWGADTQFYGGSGETLWNEYPQLYSEAYYQFANSKREAITFSRAGYTGSQRYPLHWAGDEHSTWEAFQHSIYAGLSASISGISFWGWDFGGFSGEIPSAELYIRAATMAVFCPVLQYHSEYNAHRSPSHDRTPWNIQDRTEDARVVPTFQQLMQVRETLMPYILEEAKHSAQTGQPMMRALKLWHPQARDFDYYFGRDLIVYPVVEPDVNELEIFVPDGAWMDYWTGETITGGQTIRYPTPFDRIPVLKRANS